jgi:hypothetical protein
MASSAIAVPAKTTGSRGLTPYNTEAIAAVPANVTLSPAESDRNAGQRDERTLPKGLRGNARRFGAEREPHAISPVR